MARVFNYTGRRRLPREKARFELKEDAQGLSFDAQVTLDDPQLDPHAQVWVEAYRQSLRMHFDFGTVAKLKAPDDRRLPEFDSPDGLLFRVRVTATGNEHGKLLAVADKIRPSQLPGHEQPVDSILGLASRPLNGLVWEMDFEDGPILVLEEQIEDRQAVANSDSFLSLVLPEALRRILERILLDDDYSPPDGEESDWQHKWLLLAEKLPGVGARPKNSASTRDETLEWISDCVQSFGRNHLKAWSRFEAQWEANQ